MLIARIDDGGFIYDRQICLTIGMTKAEELLHDRQFFPLPKDAKYEIISLEGIYNGDIRSIFKQKYLSPRPKTVSAQLGTDGFSAWTFVFWGVKPPEITLEKTGIVETEGGVPFLVSDGVKNIAFASRWDNWPDKITVPVGKKGRAVFLQIAGSTNPLQCGMENARLTFRYEDGTADILPLIAPDNYLNLCDWPDRASSNSHRVSYFHPADRWCLPDEMPPVIQLGKNLRAMQTRFRLREKKLDDITFEAMSPEIVSGILSATLLN